jgi:hypothetical protein
MLRRSRDWHEGEDIWWAVLSFRAEILEHDGVIFADSNNAYPVTSRAPGVEGLETLFAPRVVWGKFNTVAYRAVDTPSNQTTHEQAEVLYPRGVSLQYLQAIYVAEPDHIDVVAGQVEALADFSEIDLRAIPVLCDPSVFA